jgi:drug/metabolite transporter (DMT)-like permease
MTIDLSPQGSVALGVIVGLLSTCVQSVGLTLQRKSHLLEEEKEEQDPEYYQRRPPYRRRRWQIGASIFLIANLVGSTVQITTLPLPVLSTLQASGLVFNTACATAILHEPFTRYSVFGTLLVAAGAVLIAIYGSLTEPSHNLDQLLTLLSRPSFIIWILGTFLVAFGLIVTMWFLRRTHLRPTIRVRLARGMAYGAISGILSAHCLLLAKSAVELLVRTIADHSNQFNRWQSWIILLGLVLLALSQLYCLHRGLKLCSTSVLYPFVFCIYNIIAILDGLIYFRQTSRITVQESCLIALGTVILLAGVFALSWRLSDSTSTPPPTPLTTTSPETSKWLHRRIPTPQSALEPGLGLVSAATAAVDSNETPESPSLLRHTDTEQALPWMRASETTPLLRTSTAPTWQRIRSRTRPSKVRRLTAEAAGREEALGAIWDELNDRRSEERRVSFAGRAGPLSPGSSRSFGRARGKRRADTVAGGERWRRASSGQATVLGVPWSQWRDFARGTRGASAIEGVEAPPELSSEPDDETDGEAGSSAAGGSKRTRWALREIWGRRNDDASRPMDGVGGWFQLRWWKRKRKEPEVNERDDDNQ